jgi:hypothetical protein
MVLPHVQNVSTFYVSKHKKQAAQLSDSTYCKPGKQNQQYTLREMVESRLDGQNVFTKNLPSGVPRGKAARKPMCKCSEQSKGYGYFFLTLHSNHTLHRVTQPNSNCVGNSIVELIRAICAPNELSFVRYGFPNFVLTFLHAHPRYKNLGPSLASNNSRSRAQLVRIRPWLDAY